LGSYSQRILETIAATAALRSNDPTRHKCFISYHHDDQDEVEAFVDTFGDVFIAKALGVSSDDDFIDSDDKDYVMRRIRELYLKDSTVTMVLLGKCTWSRRFVDWEVASTLRNDPNNKRSGLMAINLPSAPDSGKRLPDRVSDNITGGKGTDGYARWWVYPSSGASLRSWIDIAFESRTSLGHLVDNARDLFKNNRSC